MMKSGNPAHRMVQAVWLSSARSFLPACTHYTTRHICKKTRCHNMTRFFAALKIDVKMDVQLKGEQHVYDEQIYVAPGAEAALR